MVGSPGVEVAQDALGGVEFNMGRVVFAEVGFGMGVGSQDRGGADAAVGMVETGEPIGLGFYVH